MKLIYVSNYLNHHSAPLCQQFISIVDDFAFVATIKTEGIGFTQALQADYVLDYTDPAMRNEIEDKILRADCVIFGSCPNELIQLRMAVNKLSFLYSERFFKKGTWRRFIPQTRSKINERIGRFKNHNIYALCASSYLPQDLRYFGFSQNKCFKWGYFPQAEQYTTEVIYAEKQSHETVRITWAGRMISWKHPEILIPLTERLRDEGYQFELNIVGSGPVEGHIKSAIYDKQLTDRVKMLGALSPQVTRKQMFQSDIFLFTSDYNEGWGAVLNEAMNAGCAVVACEAAGSVPFLIQDGINGFSYAYGDKKKLHNCVKKLIMNRDLRLEMGMNAHKTISVLWNAENAAEKFLKLANGLLNGEQVNISDGPCSRA